jgi:hypothetical protein
MAPVKKMREVFVLHPVTGEKPLSVFENSFHLPRIVLEETYWSKMAVLKGRFFFGGGVVFRTPLRW